MVVKEEHRFKVARLPKLKKRESRWAETKRRNQHLCYMSSYTAFWGLTLVWTFFENARLVDCKPYAHIISRKKGPCLNEAMCCIFHVDVIQTCHEHQDYKQWRQHQCTFVRTKRKCALLLAPVMNKRRHSTHIPRHSLGESRSPIISTHVRVFNMMHHHCLGSLPPPSLNCGRWFLNNEEHHVKQRSTNEIMHVDVISCVSIPPRD